MLLRAGILTSELIEKGVEICSKIGFVLTSLSGQLITEQLAHLLHMN